MGSDDNERGLVHLSTCQTPPAMIRLLPSLISLVLLVCQTQALYFYIDGPSQKCFFEELPKDTLVVGSYKATQWNEQSRTYVDNPEMGIFISGSQVGGIKFELDMVIGETS